jgi:hypothetical protein
LSCGPDVGSERTATNDAAETIGQQGHADSACVMAPV